MAIAASIAFALVVGWQVLPLDREPVASKALARWRATLRGTTGTVPCTLRWRSPRSLWRRQPGAIARSTRHYAPLRATARRHCSVRSGSRRHGRNPWSALVRIQGQNPLRMWSCGTGHVASILLTPVDQAPATHAQAAPCPSSEGFQVACFDARGHAGFVVSDLTDAENLELARDLAPVLQTYLRG